MTSILKVDQIQNTDGQQALVITPDGSIDSVKFPQAADPVGRVITSTTMSSYEEGTWIPVIEGTTTAGTGTYTSQGGSYTRIGDLVTCLGYTDITAHTGSGNILITGLPFTHGTGSIIEAVGTVMSSNLTYTKEQLVLLGNKNSKRIRFYQFGPSTNWTPVPMDTSFSVFFQFTYQTDD